VPSSCTDEKSQIQALDRTQPIFPWQPGQAERRSHNYRRHGTTSLFALDVHSGRVIGAMPADTDGSSSAPSLSASIARFRPSSDVHLVLDNSSTHKTPIIHRWLARHPRFQLHFTPTYSSWLNQVERWFAALTESNSPSGTDRSTRALEDGIRLHIATHNADPKPFIWVKTADEILASIAAFLRTDFRNRTLVSVGEGSVHDQVKFLAVGYADGIR
jgi:transposase